MRDIQYFWLDTSEVKKARFGNQYKQVTQFVIGFAALVLLAGCAGFGGGETSVADSYNIDFNADIEAIAEGVERFEANTASTSSATTLQDYVNLSDNNESILNSIDLAVQKFKTNINTAWEDLPANDNESSPSRGKLLKWAEGYETWIYYQREAQKIGSACATTSQTKSEYDLCAINNFNRLMEFERLSTSDLTVAIEGIQEWRRSVGATNG